MDMIVCNSNSITIDYEQLQQLAENAIAHPGKHNSISDVVYPSLVSDDAMLAMNKFLKEIGSVVFVTRNRYHNRLYFRHRKGV